MSQKTFCFTAGTIFALMALLHLLRISLGWEAVIAGRTLPMAASWAALPIAGYLAYQGFRLGKKTV